jgi:hypothetical protein
LNKNAFEVDFHPETQNNMEKTVKHDFVR